MMHIFSHFEDVKVILETFVNNLPEINKDALPIIIGYMSSSVKIKTSRDYLGNLSFIWYGKNFHCHCSYMAATLYLTKSGGYSFGCSYKNEIDIIQTRKNQVEMKKKLSPIPKELAYSFDLENGDDWLVNKIDPLERIYSNPDHTNLYKEYPIPEKVTDNSFYVGHSLINYWESSVYFYIKNLKSFQNELVCLQSFADKIWNEAN